MDPYDVDRDSYSMPLVFTPNDFYSLSRLFIQPGNTIWQADNYTVAELECVTKDGAEWVRWRFGRKTDAFIPSLAYRYFSRVDPVRFSFRALNQGDSPLAITSWGETPVDSWQWLQPGEERVVTLPGGPTVVVQGTELHAEHDLWLRDLTIYYPEAEGLAVTRLDVSPQMEAGGMARFDVAIESLPDGPPLELEVRHEPWTLWRIRLTDEEHRLLAENQACVVERVVPWYLSPGEATVGLTAGGSRAAGAEAATIVINTHKPGLARVERGNHNGRPTFFVEGEPFAWGGYATYFNMSPRTLNEFAQHGANLFHIPAAPGRHFHNVSAPTWLGGNAYDFGEVDQWATTILQASPDAKIVFRLALGLPPIWFADHPDARVRVRTMDGRELPWLETDSMVASLTSEEWRRDQATALRELIRFCASRPWADRVVGFHLGGAMTEEWFSWASCDDIVTPIRHLGDYSPANQQAFRAWCAERGYPYDQIPDPAARTRPGHDLFPDDEDGRHAAAYNLFINETTVETLDYFASVVKDETDGHSLTGAYFGYVILLTGEARQSTAGQFGLREALESENIDHIAGVPQFAFRHFTQVGYAGQPTAVESLLAHGKQYVDDNDLFSWLHDSHWYTEYDPEDPRRGAIEMHRRWLAAEAVRGNSNEWFSLSPKWHRDDGIMAEFELEADILTQSVSMDRTATEEIAFVVDDHTFSWFPPEAQTQYASQFLLGALGRTGAPLGVWIMSDLDKLPDRIKFVAIVNASAPRADDLEKLRNLIERGGRTLLVVGTPGLVNAETQRWNPAIPGELLGLPIRLDEGPETGIAALADGQVLCPMNVTMQAHIPEPQSVFPRAWLEGDGFLRYEDGVVAGAERPLPNGGRLIWCGVPPYASEAWLRGLLQEAGVHCYAPPPCSVHSSKELVAVTSVFEDDRDISLEWPEEVTITDMFDGWQGQGNTITCPFAHGQTRLFRVTPAP